MSRAAINDFFGQNPMRVMPRASSLHRSESYSFLMCSTHSAKRNSLSIRSLLSFINLDYLTNSCLSNHHVSSSERHLPLQTIRRRNVFAQTTKFVGLAIISHPNALYFVDLNRPTSPNSRQWLPIVLASQQAFRPSFSPLLGELRSTSPRRMPILSSREHTAAL